MVGITPIRTIPTVPPCAYSMRTRASVTFARIFPAYGRRISGWREHHLAAAAFEQGHAETGFQALDVNRERRLGLADADRGARKVAPARRRPKLLQLRHSHERLQELIKSNCSDNDLWRQSAATSPAALTRPPACYPSCA